MAGGLAPGNPANEPDKKPVKHHSHFKPSMSHYYGALAGLLNLSYAAQTVPSDEGFSVRCTSDIDTFSLKAPMMVPVRHKKAYFYVPRKAIIPENADLLTTNPLTGEDIIPEHINTVIHQNMFRRILQNITDPAAAAIRNYGNGSAGGASFTPANRIFAILQLHEIGEMFLSSNSLLHRSGISTYGFWQGPATAALQRDMTYDESMDYLFGWIKKYFRRFDVTLRRFDSYREGANFPTLDVASADYTVDLDLDGSGFADSTYISLRQLLELLREWHCGKVNTVKLRDGYTEDNVKFVPTPDPDENILPYFNFDIPQFNAAEAFDRPDVWLNLERVIAYQLTAAQWYTNDVVDAVYTTDLWHNVMRGYVEASVPNLNTASKVTAATFPGIYQAILDNYTGAPFIYGNGVAPALVYRLNGLSQNYDSVSGRCLGHMLLCLMFVWQNTNDTTGPFPTNNAGYGQLDGTTLIGQQSYAVLAYWKSLMNAQRSLRYKDYFCGSRTSPLAVGDVNVQVNNNLANVVDITKNIMMQKFLNQVNRIHRTLKEYSRGIFNQSPMFDPHEVMFIGSTEEVIGAEETNNTGEQQFSDPQSITSHLRSNSSRFGFTFDCPEFGVCICITQFEFQRVYATVTDRELMHVDRFDDFNPYMQHIGDQAIYGREIGLSPENFGYQLRYAEYKQRTDRASGPFVGNYLPGYAPIAMAQYLFPIGDSEVKLDSDFIRMRPFEFDQFYLALPNYSPAGYFHFIVRDDYDVNINRPMEAAPSIL